MIVKLLADHHLELSLIGGYTGWCESTLKMPHCWKSRVVAHSKDKDNFAIFIKLSPQGKDYRSRCVNI